MHWKPGKSHLRMHWSFFEEVTIDEPLVDSLVKKLQRRCSIASVSACFRKKKRTSLCYALLFGFKLPSVFFVCESHTNQRDFSKHHFRSSCEFDALKYICVIMDGLEDETFVGNQTTSKLGAVFRIPKACLVKRTRATPGTMCQNLMSPQNQDS